VIPQNVYSKILQSCQLVSKTEWSGLLFFKAEGKPWQENFKCTAVDFYVQDIGTHTFTTFTNDESLIDLYSDNPHFMECRMGIIHSHHGMETFFSGTDKDELCENSEGVDFYLSLIVNNHLTWKSECVYPSVEEVDGTSQLSYGRGEVKTSNPFSEKKSIHWFTPMEIEVEGDKGLQARISELLTELQKKQAAKMAERFKGSEFGQKFNSLDDFKSQRGIAPHVSDMQLDAFSNRTLREDFEDSRLFNEAAEEWTIPEIAMCCIALKQSYIEPKDFPKELKLIVRQVEEESIEIYVDEVMDNIDQIYEELTGVEIRRTTYFAVLREIDKLLEPKEMVFMKLKTAIRQELLDEFGQL